jgi:hypothetical protein
MGLKQGGYIVLPEVFKHIQNSDLDTASTPVVARREQEAWLWISAHESASFCFMPPESCPASRF